VDAGDAGYTSFPVSKTETTQEQGRAGHHMKKKTTKTVERDAAGTVVRQEEKVKK
jgi:hypothetical protein